jgi:DNA transformation protein and related proteins
VSLSAEFRDFLIDQMAGFGPVAMRRMFGGAGVYRDGLMFALVVDDILYLKADEAGRDAFRAEGLEPFSYATKHGEHTLTSYWRAPERCLDDPSEMMEWCRAAYAAAIGARAKKRA